MRRTSELTLSSKVFSRKGLALPPSGLCGCPRHFEEMARGKEAAQIVCFAILENELGARRLSKQREWGCKK